MTAAIARIFPRASVARVAAIDTFVTLALFSGFGLLLSLTVVILDQHIPGRMVLTLGHQCVAALAPSAGGKDAPAPASGGRSEATKSRHRDAVTAFGF